MSTLNVFQIIGIVSSIASSSDGGTEAVEEELNADPGALFCTPAAPDSHISKQDELCSLNMLEINHYTPV